MSDGEMFWVIANGIRMTGMPAFSPTHDENELWHLVAFVRHLDHLTEKEEAQLKEERTEGAAHHHNEETEPAKHEHADGAENHHRH
jgi:mono/diheme cytochrome c family protein